MDYEVAGVGLFKKRGHGSNRVQGIGDDHIIACCVVRKKFEAIADDDFDLW